jgi:hypothetical protein
MDLNTLIIPQNNPVSLYVHGLYIDGVPVVPAPSNALTNSELITDIVPNSICLFSGENKTDCLPDETITIDQNTHLTTISYDLVCEGSSSIKNGNILGLYSDDNSNACSIQCDIDGNLNLNSVQDKQVNINNNLNVGGNTTTTGIVSNGDIQIHNVPSNPNYSVLAMNEDDGLDIVNFNGEITFATQQYTRTFNQMASDIDRLKEIITNLTSITF